MQYSDEAAALWNEYAEEFEHRWGMQRDIAAIIGARGKQLFAAEYRERGKRAYRDSVVLPIRNAFYSAAVIDRRWQVLQTMNLQEPILDYGCGVGFTLLWLKKHGFNKLYAHEIKGIQRQILYRMIYQYDIKRWHNEKRPNTILCTNVLEHVDKPVLLLKKLMKICPRVIANICDDHNESSHVASDADIAACRDILSSQKESVYLAAQDRNP